MSRLIKFILTLTIFAPVWATAQDAKELSLDDAVDFALHHNASVKNARLDVMLQKAKNDEITGSAYPQLSAKGEYDHYLKIPIQYIPNPFGNPDSTLAFSFALKNAATASATASQILFNGSVMVALQARNTLIKLSQQSVSNSEENLRYNIHKAYYSVVVAQKSYQILKSSLANSRSILHDVIVTKENGLAEKIDVDRTSVQVNNLATDSMRIGNLLETSEQLLKYQMGMDIDQPIILTDTVLDAKLSEASGMVSEEVDYNNRTDFNMLKTQLKLNEYDLKRHKLSGLPSLNTFISAGYQYSSDHLRGIFVGTYPFNSLVGLQMGVPIFDGLQRHNRVKQAKLTIEKTKNSIDDLKLGIDLQAAQSRTTLRNSLLTVENQRRNIDLAGSVLDLANKKYKAGVGSNLEVNQAQTDFLQAQNNYFSSLLDVINAQADLQKALGLLK